MKIYRKLILGLTSIAMTAICLVSTTYAWFEVSKTATVSKFDFDVTGGLGFLVSVDGSNFSSSLSTSQIQKAIVAGYDASYTLEDNELYLNGSKVSDAEIAKILNKNILLYPVTSADGKNITNLSGTSVSSSGGKYIKFDMYFKATSADEDEGLKYGIYLCGDEVISGGRNEGQIVTTETTENTVKGTYIKSEKQRIELFDTMTFYNKVTGKVETRSEEDSDSINVYTSNALRFSAVESQSISYEDVTVDGDTKKEWVTTDTIDDNDVMLYELTSDDLSNDVYNLGSYASDYSEIHQEAYNEGDTVTDLEALAFDSRLNAMYNYYNNIRPYAKLTQILVKYDNTDIRFNTLGYDDIKGTNAKKHLITTVSSGQKMKKVTFRFWLEGWDADCFDGLANSINVHLLFNSTTEVE